jgi:hypothetical protein
MYAGCSGETCIYACCITVKVCICGKILFLALETANMDFKSTQGNGKRPSEQIFIG